MRLLFICSSLDPGRDGAGDQTRSLAGELIRRGHHVSVLSLYDFGVKEYWKGTQDADGILLHALRIPANLIAKHRYRLLASWVKEFNPEWISLQFVSFGFNKYGLPWHLLLGLRKAIGNVKLHIMLWELWCGMAQSAGYKEKLLGLLQKAFLRVMLNIIKPNNISTSTPSYLNDLKQIGIDANLIHVFGNISPSIPGNTKDWEDVVFKSKLFSLVNNPNDWLILGFFGSVYPCPGLEQLLRNAAEAASLMHLKFGILSIGLGRGQDVSILAHEILGSAYWKTGALPPAMINRAMNLVDMGVVTTDAAGLSKSSTAAAWIERGIPVIISAQDYTYNKSTMENQGVFQIFDAASISQVYKQKDCLLPKSFLHDAVSIYSSLS